MPALHQDQSEDRGFSQVDLLALLGALAILGLLLTPALARTRVTDQGLQCRNNLRQLIQGWQMYADENSSKLPDCFDWVYGGMSYDGGTDNTNLNYLVNGLLGPFVKSVALYKCPADMSQSVGTRGLPRVRSVSMSQSFCLQNEGRLEADKPNYYRHYLNSADMVRPAPANLCVLLDESPDTLNDGAFAVRMDPYGTFWQDSPTILHDGGCSFAFGDGHSDIKRWTDQRTLYLKVGYGSTPVHYGISQPNNADIMWLQDRTTAPKR